MDGKGRALDNIFTERLWRTITYEEVNLHEYASPKEAWLQLRDYLQCSINESNTKTMVVFTLTIVFPLDISR